MNGIDLKTCWICYETENENDGPRDWKNPCRCTGATKWVHNSCALRWINMKQRHEQLAEVRCPQCRMLYRFRNIVFGESYLCNILYEIYNVFHYLGVFGLTVVLPLGSFWLIFMLSISGAFEMDTLKKGCDTLKYHMETTLLISFPFLFYGYFMLLWEPWEYIVLKRLQKYSMRLYNQHYRSSFLMDVTHAVLMPVVSLLIGNVLFYFVPFEICRLCLGIAIYVTLKGMWKITFEVSKWKMLRELVVIDYNGFE